MKNAEGLKMAYYNRNKGGKYWQYNNNNNNNNNNYNRYNNRHNNYDNRGNDGNSFESMPHIGNDRFNNNNNMIGFDATAYKRPDILIKSINGKVYKIRGEFGTAFSAELLQTVKNVESLRDGKTDFDVEQFPEMYNVLKQWALSFINLNSEGIVYDMSEIDSQWNNLYVLYNLISFAVNELQKQQNEYQNNNRTNTITPINGTNQ